MIEKREIIVELCMGSACFARGNNSVASRLERLIDAEKLHDIVTIRGSTCNGLCKDGPIVRVNGVPHYGMTIDRLTQLLRNMTKE